MATNESSPVRAWGERLGALAIGVVLFNVNVTDAGDPLSSISGSTAAVVPGITPEVKAVLYAVLTLVGAAVALWSTTFALRGDARRPVRVLGSAAALLAAAAVAGLALDHRDGPVRLVQLLVYVTFSLFAIRAVLLGLALRHPVPASRNSPQPVA